MSERIIPFWMINEAPDTSELTRQLEGMKEKGITQFVINPRWGLPEGFYLSPEWFKSTGHILVEAGRLGMGIWIHDDINWPSGTGGGRLTQPGSPNRAMVLGVSNGDNLTSCPSSFKIAYQKAAYLDVLSDNAAKEFIGLTHEAYKRNFGEHFGGIIKGFYTDEPGFYANFGGVVDAGTVPFTEDLPKQFRQRRGYNPEKEIPYMWKEQGARSRRIRQDYFQTISELYQERFLGRLRQWCHKNKLFFIGHLAEEEDPLNSVKSQADPFAAAKNFDWAGYDLVAALTQPHIISARLAHSIALINQKPEVMAETMGSFGWKMTPEQMFKVAKFHAEHGTTILVPHALFYSINGDRRYESPPSLMEEPYWSEFGKFVQTFEERAAKHEIKPAQTAVFYPVRALWASYNPGNDKEARGISETVKLVSLGLASDGKEFDYLNEEALENPPGDYSEIVFPRATVLSLDSLKALKKRLKEGCQVTFVGSYPRYSAEVKDQQKFDILMQEIKSDSLINFQPLDVKASSIMSKLPGIQYLVWQRLARISPRYAAMMSELKGLLR